MDGHSRLLVDVNTSHTYARPSELLWMRHDLLLRYLDKKQASLLISFLPRYYSNR